MATHNDRRRDRMGYFMGLLGQRPDAAADICGGDAYPDIRGRAVFYQTQWGVLTAVQVFGLPRSKECCRRDIFGWHIHGGSSCTGNEEDPFAGALAHYNPLNCAHPQHAGDLPPLFGNDGYAMQVFLTDRFAVKDIIGRTVIIHSDPDDFITQPSGNSGRKIACGEIAAHR